MILTLLALAPAIALCIYIFIKDRNEKEPLGLLVLLFFMGILTIIPSLIFELTFEEILNGIFAGKVSFTEESTACVTMTDYLYQFVDAFFGVALIEEFFKWGAMFWITAKSKHFNSLFDGMVYAVFVSLGFAAVENILYVFENGLGVAIVRMLTSVPAHMFFAVFMGFYYSLWNVNKKSEQYKDYLFAKYNYRDTLTNPFPTKKLLVLSLTVPVLVHGAYDFLLMTENILCILVFLVGMIGLYIYCFKKVSKFSKNDRSDFELAQVAVFEKYPELAALEQQDEAANLIVK